MKKIGIITFHNSYNCGSMLESYAMQESLCRLGGETEIVNFSSVGQRRLYMPMFKWNSFKNIIKNLVLLPHIVKLKTNNEKYESFKNNYFHLGHFTSDGKSLRDNQYSVVVAGSDQIWNITIDDADDAYFLDWVKTARRVAYAPSFGSKNPQNCSKNPSKYARLIKRFHALSVREANGKRWIKELTNRDAELLIDPTLLLAPADYETLLDNSNTPNSKYIFFYCPSFDMDICRLVMNISKKYRIPVIAWSAKNYYLKAVWRFGFKLPKYENPSVYLSLIRNAELVITTSFHGTIFSSMFKKKFFTIKNGGMLGDDDRVKTLVEQLGIQDRVIPITFDEHYDYMSSVDYNEYNKKLPVLQKKACSFIKNEIISHYEKTK